MAIDSVNGGSSDPNEARRRALEEERARDLDRIERSYRDQVAKTEEAREAALKRIYASQEETVEEKRHAAQDRIERVKAEADSRIQAFERDTIRMTEEAKRQYQHRAATLDRNSKELEDQRQYLLKQHSDTMRKTSEEQERQRFEQKEKLDHEANQTYLDQKYQVTKAKDHAKAELERIHNDTALRKDRELAESNARVNRAKSLREGERAGFEKQLQFERRRAAEQLEAERQRNTMTRMGMQHDLESRQADIRREGKSAIGKEALRGQRGLEKTREQFRNDERAVKTAHETKVRDAQMRSEIRMNAMESEAELQEQIAAKGFQDRRRQFEAETEAVLAGHAKNTQALRDRMDEEFRAQDKALRTEFLTKYEGENKDMIRQIQSQRKRGGEQVQKLAVQEAHALAEHKSKASDPFYGLRTMGTRVSGETDAYVVTLEVPEHEQEKVRVTEQQGALTVSGTRRSEVKAALPEGQKASTSSYQSFSESFPVTGKLDMARMTRSYADGRLTFRIPRS